MSALGSPADPYALLPELYDLEHDEFTDDIGFYLQLAEVIGDPILELGCGTGRVLRPLALAGRRVTGVDLSGPMLERASDLLRSAGAPDRVTLHQGLMTEADQAPGGPFGLAIISLNGLMHLPTLMEQRTALASIRQALDPRGLVVIDLQSPSPEWLGPFDGRVHHEGSWVLADGTTVDRFSARTHDAASQRIDAELWYDFTDASGAMRRVRSRFPMRYIHRAELELLLELAGFVEWQVYGSYDLDPYDDGSERLIVTAEVIPSRR